MRRRKSKGEEKANKINGQKIKNDSFCTENHSAQYFIPNLGYQNLTISYSTLSTQQHAHLLPSSFISVHVSHTPSVDARIKEKKRREKKKIWKFVFLVLVLCQKRTPLTLYNLSRQTRNAF